MTSPATPPPAARPSRGPSLWPRLLLLAAVGGGLAAPLIAAAVLQWTARSGAGVAENFLTALRDGQADRLAALLTPQARDAKPDNAAGPPSESAGERIVRCFSGLLHGADFSLGTPYRRGDSLVIPFVTRADKPLGVGPSPRPPAGGAPGAVNNQGAELVLRRAGGAWRVSGLHMPRTAASAQGVEIDFEHPGADWDAPSGPRRNPEAEAFDQIGPVTPEEFAAAWQIDVDEDDIPAGDLLKKLTKEGGVLQPVLPINSPLPGTLGDVRQALSRRVSLHLQKVSRLQAIEEICRRIGVYPTYSGTYVQYQRGKRRLPVAFAGPFLLLVAGVNEDAHNAAGTLSLQLVSLPLPPKVAGLFGSMPLSVSLKAITGPAGQDLFFAEKGVPSGVNNYRGSRGPGDFFVYLRPSQMVTHWAIPLKNLLRDVDAIREVRISLHTSLPGEVHSLRLPAVAAGATAADGPLQLTLSKIVPPSSAGADKGPNRPALTNHEFRLEPPGNVRLCYLAEFPGGGVATGWSSFPNAAEFTVPINGEPSRFAFKVLSAPEDLSWDFTLRDIVLARRPRQIEPLRFDGHPAPLQVGETKLTETGVDFSLTNYCQKDLDVVDVKLSYRDKEGHPISEVVRRVSGAAGEDVDLVLPFLSLLGEGDPEWRVKDPTGRPPGAHSVEATVTRALFKDGTTWRP